MATNNPEIDGNKINERKTHLPGVTAGGMIDLEDSVFDVEGYIDFDANMSPTPDGWPTPEQLRESIIRKLNPWNEVTTGSTVASALGIFLVKENLRKGETIEFPDWGIKLTLDDFPKL